MQIFLGIGSCIYLTWSKNIYCVSDPLLGEKDASLLVNVQTSLGVTDLQSPTFYCGDKLQNWLTLMYEPETITSLVVFRMKAHIYVKGSEPCVC